MARRSDHSRDELKEMAISAGQKIINSKGLSAFSARKVARDIGYTIGTLYNVFGSHENLILHINATTLDDMNALMVEQLSKQINGKSTIKKLASCYINFAEHNYNRWRALFNHSLPSNTSLPDWYEKKIKKLFSILEAPLLPLVNNNSKKAKQAAQTIWASIHGICELGLTDKLDIVGTTSIQTLTDSLIDNYIAGVSA